MLGVIMNIGGDFIDRDKVVNIGNRPPSLSASVDDLPPVQAARMQQLNDILGGFWFTEDDLQDLSFRLEADWDNLAGPTKRAKARELVRFCVIKGRLDELYRLVRSARPKLNL